MSLRHADERCCSFILRRTASFSTLTSDRRSFSLSPSQKSRIFSRSPVLVDATGPVEGAGVPDELGDMAAAEGRAPV